MTGTTKSRRPGSPAPKWRAGPAVALAALLLGAAPAAAQSAASGTHPGWLAWLGCWEIVQERADAAEETAPSLLCVGPEPDGAGVEWVTIREDRVLERRVLGADGRREAVRDECTGWERTTFSADGRRAYLRSEHRCPGGVERVATALLAWASPGEWIEARTVSVGGSPSSWVRRYRAAPPDAGAAAGVAPAPGPTMAVESARMAAAAPLRVDHVIDATSHVHPDAVRAWLVERGERLDLDADGLLRMAEAGVPPSVVDVAVAVSYPDRFAVGGGAVEEQGPAASRRSGRGYRSRGWRHRGWRYRGWYGYGPSFFYGRSLYYYDPFYGPWGYRGLGYGYRPSVVYVVPRSGTDAGGRVVNGRGYDRSGSGGRAVRSPDSSDRSPPSASSGRDRSRPSGVSPDRGYRGGSSSDTGRRARPRSGGNDDGGNDDGGS